MKFRDIFLTVLIILLFIALYCFSIISVGMKKVKEQWPEYRCNPMVMPFASQFGHDSMENFTFCIGNMQKGAMGFFLQPIHYLTSILGDLGGDMMGSLQQIRKMMTFIRTSVTNVTGDIFGVFLNMLIQVQKIIINLKDLAMKIVGVMTTVMYIMSSSMKLGQSIWKGPIGGILRTLCFHPSTPVKLISGKYVKIKDISLGDVLSNNATVVGTLKLKGGKMNPYYRIWSRELEEYIYVTGEHHILNVDSKNEGELEDNFDNYIKVSSYNSAEKTTIFDTELNCLITTNHRIPIGEYTFWDWED